MSGMSFGVPPSYEGPPPEVADEEDDPISHERQIRSDARRRKVVNEALKRAAKRQGDSPPKEDGWLVLIIFLLVCFMLCAGLALDAWLRLRAPIHSSAERNLSRQPAERSSDEGRVGLGHPRPRAEDEVNTCSQMRARD